MTNIALIVLDTLRKDTFDEYFDWLSGIRFENAWSTSHWTVPAHASLFTGQYASDVGVHARAQYLDYEDKTLAEKLQQEGYRTRGFSTNSHITPHFNFDRGFNEFNCEMRAKKYNDRLFSLSEQFQPPRSNYPKQAIKSALGVVRGEFAIRSSLEKMYRHLSSHYPTLPSATGTSAGKALSYIREVEFGSDEFLFVNLMDVHGPYNPPLRYQRRRYSRSDIMTKGMETFSDKTVAPEAARDAYEDCARHLSDKLQKIIDELDNFDYIITLSDHGESFGEDSVWAHIYGLHPSLTQIPLVITGPDRKTSTEETTVNLLDVYATILDIAEVDDETEGRPLLNSISTRPCLTEYHGITHEKKLEKLQEYGVSDTEIAAIDEPRFGMSLPPSYYRYETLNDTSVVGESEYEDPEALLEELKTARPALNRTGHELGEAMESQLSQLGYL